MKQLRTHEIFGAYVKKQYYLHIEPYRVNIFGVRLSNSSDNTFNDCVGLLWKDNNGNFFMKQYDATTDPGTYYRLHPMNSGGCAVMIPGQYKDAYKIGLHHDYEAMQQVGKMNYIRDNNKNTILDWVYKQTGQYKMYSEIASTNIHHAYKVGTTKNVDNWSAGCQVFANIDNFNEFMGIVKGNVNDYKFPNLFTYTLFESDDIG
jgi:hypothetical protein